MNKIVWYLTWKRTIIVFHRYFYYSVSVLLCSRVLKVPRAAILECKSTPRNVALQHTVEVLKSVQPRFAWLGVEPIADVEKLNASFLDFVV